MLRQLFKSHDTVASIQCRLIIPLLFLGTSAISAQENSLQKAIEQGNTAAVRAQLKNGVDVNSRLNLSITPLHLAVWHEHPEIVKILIDAGARLNARTRHNGATVMHYAAVKGNVEILSLLVQAGGDVNVRTSPGRNVPLHWATMEGQLEAVKTLLKMGADIDARDKNGNTSLKLAIDGEHNEIMNWLLGQNGGY